MNGRIESVSVHGRLVARQMSNAICPSAYKRSATRFVGSYLRGSQFQRLTNLKWFQMAHEQLWTELWVDLWTDCELQDDRWNKLWDGRWNEPWASGKMAANCGTKWTVNWSWTDCEMNCELTTNWLWNGLLTDYEPAPNKASHLLVATALVYQHSVVRFLRGIYRM